MHDFSLGPPIDIGEYDGPLLNGEPIHSGTCEDGVYGCRRCNSAIRCLSKEDRATLGIEDTQSCDWCRAEVDVSDIVGVRPWDEPSVYYEVCWDCKSKHDSSIPRY